MPFKSKAQQRFMFAAEDRGDIPKGTARRWAHHTKDIKHLPEKKKKGKKMKKKGELVLQKYASLICNLPDRKRDLVAAQLLYPATEKTAAQKLARVLSSLPVKKQMKLAAAMLTSKEGSFVKQSAEVMVWRRQIDRLSRMLPIEKKAFWGSFFKTAALPALALGAGKFLAANVLPSLAISAVTGGFSGGDATETQTTGPRPAPHMKSPMTPPGMMSASRPY
jgi:hypothetical protein